MGGQLLGELPKATHTADMRVNVTVMARSVPAQTEIEKTICSGMGREVIGSNLDVSHLRDLLSVSSTSTIKYC